MAAAAATYKERMEDPDGMKGPLTVSAIIHIGLVILAITGLPYFFKPEPQPMISSIPVEILPIAELTTTNKKIPIKAAPTPEPEKLEKPPEKKPAPPKVEEVKPPDVPKPPKAAEAKPKPKPVTPPPPDEAALEKAKEEPKPEEKKPPEPAEAKEKAEEQTEDFNKLLKNLQDSKPQVDDTLPESKDAAPPAPTPEAPYAETMTMSEADALARQLQRCWSIQAGARYAEDLIVKVRLTVSPERRTLSAVIVDQWRYSQDSYFRAAADAAIRAVHSPQCEVLELPPDKYEMWKDIVVTFDPTDML